MRQHFSEEVKSENLLTRLDELEREEAKVVWMEKFEKIERNPEDVSGTILIPEHGDVSRIKVHEMFRIVYKK